MRKNDDADKPKLLTKGETAELLGIGIDLSKLSDTRGLFISDKILFYGDSLLKSDDCNISGCVFYKCTFPYKFADQNTLLVDCTLSEQDSFHFNLQKADLKGANLEYANLEYANLEYANLRRANLTRANLSGADLSGTSIDYTLLTGSDLSGSNLSESYFHCCGIDFANFEGSELHHATFNIGIAVGVVFRDSDLRDLILEGPKFENVYEDCDFSYSDLTRVQTLRKTKFKDCNFTHANLTKANLYNGIFENCTLDNANFSYSIITEKLADQLTEAQRLNTYILKPHANLKNALLEGIDFQKITFSMLDLRGADLTGAELSRSNMENVNLSSATLVGSQMNGTRCKRVYDADLTDSSLTNADLTRADLTRTNLTRTNLTGANLTDACVHEADFNNANLSGTILSSVGLQTALNLETANLTGAFYNKYTRGLTDAQKSVMIELKV